MICISGNISDKWYDKGIENKDHSLVVNCCGYQKLMTKNLTRRRSKGRLDFQLIYIASGNGRFHINNKTQHVSNGQIVIYTPNEPQHYQYDASKFTEVYWIHFTGYEAHDYLKEFGLLNHSIHTVGVQSELISVFERIIHELNIKKPLREHLTTAKLVELLALFGRAIQSNKDFKKFDYEDINKTIQLMHKKYSHPIRVQELADVSNLSVYRFIHKFKAATGVTPMKYITDIRINEAKKLLSETSFNVSEVSSIVGYDNPLYFSRVFRKIVGMPPSHYREQF